MFIIDDMTSSFNFLILIITQIRFCLKNSKLSNMYVHIQLHSDQICYSYSYRGLSLSWGPDMWYNCDGPGAPV